MNHKSAKSSKELKTYSRLAKNTHPVGGQETKQDDLEVPLTTLNAVKYLLQGTLRLRVCRYCLNVTNKLSEFDEVLTLAVSGGLHEVTIRDIVASFHPYKVTEDPNFPNKICNECVNRAISCYLFTQQCERAERALRNCLDDVYEKFEKLDPIEPVKRRGKRKLHPNHNVIHAEHEDVMGYAEPVINIVNVTNHFTTEQSNNKISELECKKCWQVLPNVESLVNHETSHPKSMWFNCRLCGKSFVKCSHLRRHIKETHQYIEENSAEIKIDDFKCNECGSTNKTLAEHLQHNEKHKFKSLFKCLVERKVDSLCTVCFDKSSRLTSLNDVVHLHGGYTGLTGDKSIENILTAAIPGINFDTYTGTKICDKCYNHAISCYIFIVKIHYVHSRLHSCVSSMLDRLVSIGTTDENLMVEISKDTILPMFELEEINESSPKDDDDELKVEILEDEFRISESESSESESIEYDDLPLHNPAKNITKTYAKKKLFNGYQDDCEDTIFRDVCSEFLTFRKKFERPKHTPKYRYTCPFCNKHFISDYFLKKHILKHVQRKVQCNICLNYFKSKFYLFEHKKTSHALKSKDFITCKICGRTFISVKKMKSHHNSHRIKECQLCEKLFISQKHYDVHMQKHAVKFKAYKNSHVQTCSFCEKACSNENELSLHVNKMHLQIKPYSCDMCDKQFYTETNLLSHKKLHSLFSKETCAFCGQNFKCRKSLVIHVRKHIGMKPHVCPVCKQSFYSDLRLKKHMKTFHGGIYSCRLCKTVLSSQLDLKSHINLMHSSM
ncbi:zinc finger protein 26-like isoform X2 [Maniola jurtina]|uniref:zinc finger protein 26-like isoform X2 n=1 Tax=Maniola jurtina TaxID=191418 RepID=UPI001E68A7B2|nr:zinc finger protein 26-like isoform X2 [Maniola jurtina]